jgi:hypothetical protein
MRLATIQRIHSITPHPNPEVLRIECAKIKEWPVVIPKGIYKNDDLVVFIEIDSVVPATDAFAFMERQKYRVWNARFKGAPSSGLVQPLSIIDGCQCSGQPHGPDPEPDTVIIQERGPVEPPPILARLVEGDDVTELLGVIKYERPLDLSVSGQAQGWFPTHIISISDETNALGYPEALLELEGKQIYITQKADGSSTTFIYGPNKEGIVEYQACSRRQILKEGSGFPWRATIKYDIKNKMIALDRHLAIQAESIGPKLNGNSMELKDIEIRTFRVKDLTTRKIIGFEGLENICTTFGLPMVKVIEVCDFDKNIHTVEYFRKLADSQTWDSNGKPAEGIVVAPTIPFYSPTLKKEWSVKFVNQDYK